MIKFCLKNQDNPWKSEMCYQKSDKSQSTWNLENKKNTKIQKDPQNRF